MKGFAVKIIIGFILILLTITLFVFAKVYEIQKQFQEQTGLTPLTTLKLLVNGGAPLKTEDDRINILLLGVGGGVHEGGDLTDTIIVASIPTASPSMQLISVPRDIWSEDLKDRINSAYHYGEQEKEGNGLIQAKKAISDIVGFPISYSVLFDFSGFKKIVDLVGGIDVIVRKPFVDKRYPIEGKENDTCDGDITYACRYETIQYDMGIQHMDGEKALKYVRSRYSEGTEGTDFARGERQQDVISALKKKILEKQPWFHPSFFLQLLRSFDEASDMDMSIAQALTIGKILYGKKDTVIQKISIEPLLRMPPQEEFDRYVLMPVTSFLDIHDYIRGKLNN